MNLEDVIDPEYGLQQDEWSLTKPRFGKDGQLEVVGWSGRNKCHKYYIVRCVHCGGDSELFGEGYFKDVKGHLQSGGVPCGCSKSPKWSKKQYKVLCQRKAEELGYKFLDFVGDWHGNKTKISVMCIDHGEWVTTCINDFFGNHGCPECKAESTRAVFKKPDSEMIASFFASGAFHPDTKFWRISDEDNYATVFWGVDCPECGQKARGMRGNLQGGHKPCACSRQRQQECYINLVTDENNNVLAIKFGIAIDSIRRVLRQNRLSCFNVRNFAIYKFPDVASCKIAEAACLKELDCGILSKEQMPDGWTETTSPDNLLKIIEIYERNGGYLNEI